MFDNLLNSIKLCSEENSQWPIYSILLAKEIVMMVVAEREGHGTATLIVAAQSMRVTCHLSQIFVFFSYHTYTLLTLNTLRLPLAPFILLSETLPFPIFSATLRGDLHPISASASWCHLPQMCRWVVCYQSNFILYFSRLTPSRPQPSGASTIP